jgi:DNA-binding response OmpR family regulator
VVARSEFEFNRQCIVVADDDSSAAAFVIDTLRLDGHRVTYVSDVQSATVDAALSGCHLFICGSGIGGMRAVTLLTEIRDNAPDLPILCVAASLRWTRRLEGRLPPDVTILRDPLTAEALRAGVRPLLPLSAGGTTLAWSALVEQEVPRAPDERAPAGTPDGPPRA